MNDKLILAIIGGFSCILGTLFGALLSLFFKSNNKKFQSMLLEFSAGLMLSIIFLDLLHNALLKTSILNTIFGILLGIIIMMITENVTKNCQKNSLLQAGLVLSIGLAMHNLPEGLALGSSINIDTSLFYTLAISIFVHDIPEGMLIGLPLKMGGMKNLKIILVSVLTGVFALFGAIIGLNFTNESIIGSLLSIASGAMLFIVFFDIIPSSKSLYKGRASSFCNILGIITGIFLSNIL